MRSDKKREDGGRGGKGEGVEDGYRGLRMEKRILSAYV